MMGRELLVEPASEGSMAEKPLNMGQAVKDCWFCLSNDQVCCFMMHRMEATWYRHPALFCSAPLFCSLVYFSLPYHVISVYHVHL
jgi:hypothetical protein